MEYLRKVGALGFDLLGDPVPAGLSLGQIREPVLQELQELYDVNPEDIRMPASIEFRGKRPKTADGWKFILEAIRHGRKI